AVDGHHRHQREPTILSRPSRALARGALGWSAWRNAFRLPTGASSANLCPKYGTEVQARLAARSLGPAPRSCDRRTMKPFRILLADDHALVRAGIRLLLEKLPDTEIVGEAGDG